MGLPQPDDILLQAMLGNYQPATDASAPSAPVLRSAQPPPAPAPAYTPGTDLSGIDLSTGQPYPKQAPPQPGRFKRMLMGGLSAASEAMLNSAGVMTDEQKDELRASTRQKLAMAAEAENRTQMAQSSVTLPNGVQLPYSIAQKAYPELIKGDSKLDQIREQNKTKEFLGKINAAMQGAKVGYKIDIGDDGKPVISPMEKDELSIPVAAAADKKSSNPSKLSLIIAAQQGDQEAAKALDTMHKLDKDLVYARGDAFGRGRLWSLQRVYDPETGQTTLMPGFDVIKAQNSGKVLIPAGGMSQKEIISAQQLQSEAVPAITDVRKTIKAYDNPNDRAIFARIMEGAGKPAYGQEAGWMGSILNQALKENLSPEGKHQAQALARLAETMGRLRSTLGLPATDQSMAITMALLPGKSTPNSKYAGEQVDQIEQMLNQAVGIPAYGGKPRPMTGNGGASPSGPKVGEIQDGYRYRGGNPSDPNSWIKVK